MSKFIVFEGLEGSGKSTATNHLKSYLNSVLGNDKFIFTREPGGTEISEILRLIIKGEYKYKNLKISEQLDYKTELLLIYAARCQHFTKKIKPFLDNGKIVICDRFNWSTFAYQGYGRNLDLSFLNTLDNFILNGFEPDFTFYLDISYEQSQKRVKSRNNIKDRFELENEKFFINIRKSYIDLCKKYKNTSLKIDASQSQEKVFKIIKSNINKLLSI